MAYANAVRRSPETRHNAEDITREVSTKVRIRKQQFANTNINICAKISFGEDIRQKADITKKKETNYKRKKTGG